MAKIPHIEGMRALAVALVLGAHAKLPLLTGGFVGVDIFFVISGYLITGLLVSELEETGQVNFAEFYARRLRRLLPLFLVVLITTALAAAFVLPRLQHPQQAAAGFWAALWLSNIHFALGDVDYFGPGADTNLYLHTWSLGVEEQFYVLWPALLALIWKKALRYPHRQTRVTMRIVLLISGCASIALSPSLPMWAFYLMPSRAWEFALGAIVWLAVRNRTISRRFGAIAGWIGIVLILGAATLFDHASSYPGWRAVLPTVGAALLLISESWVKTALSIAPMQALGRVSYGLYLWHWPMLLLGAELMPHSGLQLQLFLLAATWALAILTYHLVEAPARAFKLRPSRFMISALATIVATTLLFAHWEKSTQEWLTQETRVKRIFSAKSDAPIIYFMGCDAWYNNADLEICRFGSQTARNVAVMMGDSIGLQWFPAAKEVFRELGWSLLVITKSSCPMVDEPVFYQRIGRTYTECSEWRTKALEAVKKIRPDVLLLGSSAGYSFNDQEWERGSTRVLASLAPSTGRIYLIRPTPTLPSDGPSCLVKALDIPADTDRGAACTWASSTVEHDLRVWNLLTSVARRFDNVTTLDLNDFVCPEATCRAEREGLIVFRDTMHITATFARTLAPNFRSSLALDTKGTQKVSDGKASAICAEWSVRTMADSKPLCRFIDHRANSP